jgi:hypothetical protein
VTEPTAKTHVASAVERDALVHSGEIVAAAGDACRLTPSSVTSSSS